VFLDTEKTFVGLNIKYDQGETWVLVASEFKIIEV
jgi:hypothetical protein